MDEVDGRPGASEGVLSRRRLLIAGLATTGVAWAAPQITSVASAASCPSLHCTPVSVNLANSPFGIGVNICDGTSRNVNLTNITATRTSNFSTSGFTTGVITGTDYGGMTNSIPIVQDNEVSELTPQILTINFSNPVRQLAFTIADIDAFSTGSNAEYQEEVRLSWTVASGVPAPAYALGSLIQASPGFANRYRINSTTENCDAGNDVRCNLGVTFDDCGTISQLVIASWDLNTAEGNNSGRAIFLGNLSWCRP